MYMYVSTTILVCMCYFVSAMFLIKQNSIFLVVQLCFLSSSFFLGALFLAERIEVISTNFRIGFGSFVDKRLGTFVNLDPRRYV